MTEVKKIRNFMMILTVILLLCALLANIIIVNRTLFGNIRKPVEKKVLITTIYMYVDSLPSFMNKTPQEGLKEALKYYNVKYPEIVYAQAIHETGNFTSNLCINNNNLFGLYNSNKGAYYKFNHWHESVLAYVNLVQYKHKEGEDYYKFLTRIKYAEDPQYNNRIKSLVQKTK